MRRPTLRYRLAPVAIATAAALGPAAGVAAALNAPVVRGPTGLVGSPPSYQVAADAADGRVGIVVTYCLAPCSDPATFRVLSGPTPLQTGALPPDIPPVDGQYFVVASVTDGTTTGPAATVTFTLDTTPPGPPTVTAAPPAATNLTTPSFSWSADPSPGATYGWEVHAGADPSDPKSAVVQSADTATPSVTLKALKDGTYSFQVRATDGVGNRGAFSPPAVFTVDTARPAPPQITSPPPGPDQLSPTFAWTTSSTPGEDSFQWAIVQNGVTVQGPTPAGALTATPLTPLSLGAYTFHVVEVDPAGNLSDPATQDFTISLSKSAPDSVTGLVLTPGVGQVGLAWALADATGVASIRIVRRSDGSPTGPSDPAAAVTELAPDARGYVDVGLTGDTRYFYAVYARDLAGGFSPVAATGNVLAQAAPPVAGAGLGPTAPGPSTLPTPEPGGQRPVTLNPKRLHPLAGATLSVERPMLRWKGRPGGVVLYNLQIFDAKGRKLLKAFPRRERYQVPTGVLQPGKRYFWRVWPWFGPVKKFSSKPLGISYFQVATAKKIAAAAAARSRRTAATTRAHR
jgi:predicted phage tail protein